MSSTRERLVVVTALLFVACSNSLNGPGTGGEIEGTWDAVSVNGAALPMPLPTLYGCAHLGLSGAVDVRNGRFTATYRYQVKCSGYPTQIIDQSIAGSYAGNGGSFLFAPDSGFSRFEVGHLVSASVNGPIMEAQSSPAPATTIRMTLRRR